MSREFTAAQVFEITKVSQRSLDYWDKTDFLKPSGSSRQAGRKNARGKGRLYTYSDLIKICTVARLRKAGIELTKIRKAQDQVFRKDRKRQLLLQTVATDGKKIEWKRDDGTVIDALKYGQRVFAAISIHSVERDVEKVVARIVEEERSENRESSRRRRSGSRTAG